MLWEVGSLSRAGLVPSILSSSSVLPMFATSNAGEIKVLFCNDLAVLEVQLELALLVLC